MSHKNIGGKLQVAPRGSKLGWPTRSTQLPPDTDARLLRLAMTRGLAVTDLIREAVEAYLPQSDQLAA